MTIIDTHTHTFPDKIADKTITLLEKKGNVRAYRKGTLDALKESMKKSGIDYSVVLPVATKASQVDTINKSTVLTIYILPEQYTPTAKTLKKSLII